MHEVQAFLEERAPKKPWPRGPGASSLLSGLLHCGVCGSPYTGQGAKGGHYGYYICGTLLKEGAGSCQARYLNAERWKGSTITGKCAGWRDLAPLRPYHWVPPPSEL